MSYRRSPSLVVIAAGVPSLLLLLLHPAQLWSGVLVVIAAVGACAVGWRAEQESGQGRGLPRATWPVVAVLAAVAVAKSPIGSHDLWSYAFYGRVVSVHHADPYTAVASSYPHDLVYHLVGWHHVPTAYGPLFTGYSALVARVAGNSVLALRLGFQLPAALAVLACLALLVRRGRTSTALVVALQPFVWLSVVNGGHNDAWLALGLLVAVILWRERRYLPAGLAVGLVTLVKLSGIIAVVPVVAVLVARRRWRAAMSFSAGSVGVFVIGALWAPKSLTNASKGTRTLTSIASVWHPIRAVFHLSGSMITLVSLLLVMALVAWWTWMHRDDRDVSFITGAATSAFPLASSYSLPWYSVWGLPALALSGDVVATSLVASRGSLILAANSIGTRPADLLFGGVLTIVVPIALLVAFHLHVTFTRPAASNGQRPRSSSVGTSTTR